MDPISGSKIAGEAVSLTIKLLHNMYVYYNAIRNAPARSAELRRELNMLLGLLVCLQETSSARKPKNCRVFIPSELLEEMYRLLNDLYARVAPKQTEGLAKLAWPLKQKDNFEYIQKIERYKTGLMIALSNSQRFTN